MRNLGKRSFVVSNMESKWLERAAMCPVVDIAQESGVGFLFRERNLRRFRRKFRKAQETVLDSAAPGYASITECPHVAILVGSRNL